MLLIFKDFFQFKIMFLFVFAVKSLSFQDGLDILHKKKDMDFLKIDKQFSCCWNKLFTFLFHKMMIKKIYL